ncbi:hypothetical protein AB1285_19530 [Microbacterium sp. NRRL B-14842]|uniref:hypothetical protein n=1 Tax=Microbacterium sp. NRRL B-14842 TaxID=3162881 RepID=UPI003D2C351D
MPETTIPTAFDDAGDPLPPLRRMGRALTVFAWLSFLSETIIIGTGGAVRLTAPASAAPSGRCAHPSRSSRSSRCRASTG